MIIVDYTTLIANAFIELNKIKEVRRIKLDDIIKLNLVLKELAANNNIKYVENLTSTTYYELRYNYSMFFNIYEDVDGWVAKMANFIEPINLENYFRRNPNVELLKLLEMINFEEIFDNNKTI